MKLKSILFLSALTACMQTNAQTWVADSVTMGAGYVTDNYYSFSGTGAVSTPTNQDWDIAFQMTPQGPYGNVSVRANGASKRDSVFSLHLSATSSYATLSAADTIGKTSPSMALFNSDSSWNRGAFNQLNNPSSVFDYGWGQYVMATHYVEGDSVFLIKSNGNTYKLWIQTYVSTPTDSIKWVFRVANFDGSGDTTIHMYRKNGFTNRLFGYYSIANKTIIDREPNTSAWDILFTHYPELTPYGPNVIIPYAVTGVLSNYNTTVAQAHPIVPDSAVYTNYTFSGKMNGIGSAWKKFDQATFTYNIVDSNSYFVKAKNNGAANGSIYQIQFTNFVSSAGKVVFAKKFIAATLAVSNTAKAVATSVAIAPNPASNNASVVVDAAAMAKGTQIAVMDISGRVIAKYTVDVQQGMNAFNINTADFPAGLYMVVVSNTEWTATQRMVVQH